MKKRSIFINLLLIVLMSLAVFTNCKGKSSDSPNELIVAVYPNLNVAYKELIPEFKKKFPKVKIKLKTLGFQDHHNMLITTMAANQGAPDVAAVEIEFIGQLGAGGGFVNLFGKDYNAKKYKRNIVPYKWAQSMTTDGKMIAMPVDIAPGCIYYRKDVLDKNHININRIRSLQDVYNMGKKITKDTDGDGKIDQWLLPTASYIFFMIFNSSQYRYFDKDGKPNLKRPIVRAALKWARKFREAKMDAKISDWTNEWYAAIRNGKVVYFPMGAWLTGHLKTWIAQKEIGKFRVAALPALKRGGRPLTMSWGGSFLAIPKQSKKKKMAWEFIKFLTTNVKSQLVGLEKADAFPSWMPAWRNKIFRTPMPYLGGQNARQLWISIAKKIPNVNTTENDSVANLILISEVGYVIDKGKDIEKAMEDASRRLTERLKRIRR